MELSCYKLNIMDILKKIRLERERTLAATMTCLPESVLSEKVRRAYFKRECGNFIKALSAQDGPHLIAELKKASPSAGVIRPDFDVEKIARSYLCGGAKALSVLTEPSYFQGDLDYLRIARAASGLPVLRKDFIFHRYQLLEAAEHGADAVLLIVAMLTEEELKTLHSQAIEFGLDVLVEVHSEHELMAALKMNPPLIGINNRNLKSMTVDIETTFALCKQIPDGTLVVSESGIKTPEDVRRLREAGINGMLVGESLMRNEDPGEAARRLLEA